MSNRGDGLVSAIFPHPWEMIHVVFASSRMTVGYDLSNCPQKLMRHHVRISMLQRSRFCVSLWRRCRRAYFRGSEGGLGWDLLVTTRIKTRVLWSCGNNANIRAFRLGINVFSSGSAGQFLVRAYLALSLYVFLFIL